MSQKSSDSMQCNSPHAAPTASTAIAIANNGKNEIKVSAEGVAKLTFNFLDELQGDSSLEPGEVKTPPHDASPHVERQTLVATAAMTSASKIAPVDDAVRKELLMKALKSVSELEVDSCQEKVRAILELDAIQRREEAEKRKQQLVKRRESGEVDSDEECKKKAKEERRRLKKLKKEQKAARLALLSDNDDDDAVVNDESGKKTKKKRGRSNEQDGYDTHSSSERNDELRNTVNSGTMPPQVGRYPLAMPPPHLAVFPDGFMGFHAMNPFLRAPRPEFLHARGGFMPRIGRGNMRGNIRFPGYRPAFYSNAPLRHHGPPQRLHTPPPPRGHSPIKAPSSDLLWTKAKPSISYSFKMCIEGSKAKEETNSDNTSSDAIKKHTKSKEKSNSSSTKSKQHKKSKKRNEREKVKKRRSSRNSSEKSSKRKIEKIRKSLEKPARKGTSTPELIRTSNELKKLKALREIDSEKLTVKLPSNSETMQNTIENIKIEKDDALFTAKEITSPFELIKDSVKAEPASNAKVSEMDSEKAEKDNDSDLTEIDSKNFDMFADSPPRSKRPTAKDVDNLLHAARKAAEIIKAQESAEAKAKERAKTPSSAEKSTEIVKTVVATPSIHDAAQHHSATPPLPENENVNQLPEKTPLQRAIEMQRRIDKLLQEDDLNFETLQATKEKLLQKTKQQHAINETQNNLHANKAKARTPTPEPPPIVAAVPKHRNPFKRSLSRDRYFGKIDAMRRSRSHSRKRDTRDNRYNRRKPSLDRNRRIRRARSKSQHSACSSSGSLNHSRSGDLDKKGSCGSLNRSDSREHDRYERNMRRRSDDRRMRRISKSPRLQRAFSKEQSTKSTSVENNKMHRSKTPPKFAAEKHEKLKSRPETAKKPSNQKEKRTMQPLSFTADEFLFPEHEEDDSQSKTPPHLQHVDAPTLTVSKRNPLIAIAAIDKDDSPDTDDYMDNWENDDADIDANSNTACDNSTPLRSSQEDANDKFVTRFANPSPPLELIKQQLAEHAARNKGSTTPMASPPAQTSADEDNDSGSSDSTKSPKAKIARKALNKELFGMQEIYDQFIKSVEESGVDMKSAATTLLAQSATQEIAETSANSEEQLLSTSSTSTSSSSSSASSSDASNSSSSSTSSSSASSSDDSNDAEQFDDKSTKTVTKHKTTKTLQNELIAPVESNIEMPQHEESNDVKQSPPNVSPTTTPPRINIIEQPATPPTPMVKAQKPDAAKDFKKLKSLEANLARIQMMRANYDSADEISDELLKMEKLFLQEKNLILQKYAKATATSTVVQQTVAESSTPSQPVSGQFVNSLQNSEQQAESPATVANKIFDANREAIKLTISPLKLPKTPAIFESAAAEECEEETHSKRTNADELDFTEKLTKPAKEIAIVKPMMETKDSRSQQQQRHHRRSSPSARVSHARSPTTYRERSRRSNSRSRISPHRRGRVRSLSVSPPRRGNAERRYVSPQRRAGGAYATQRYRRRSRSRSRSRSISRQSNRRNADLSPTQHRRRRPQPSAYYRKTLQQRSNRDSRSRSPRSPPPMHSSTGTTRPHSPRSPPSHMPMRRRSYSRERYSRSPLPFKPPSPPMRRSLSPRRPSSLSPPPRSSSSRRSRSLSRSLSPRMPRSPRSPPSNSRYDDRRRRGGSSSSYDRRDSLSPHRQYYAQDSAVASTSSTYSYYNVSPNRISLDARINIVLNGPPPANQDSAGAYDNWNANYGQYGGAAYMSIPPQPSHDNAANYYANQYVPMSSSGTALPPHAHQPTVYSNIPTIGGVANNGNAVQTTTLHHQQPANFYYNEFGGGHPAIHQQQTSSLLKELPKATVAVQKGNVLEIVPSAEMSSTTALTKTAVEATKKSKKSTTISWKEEVNNRHVTAAVMRLSRENDGSSHSILRKSDVPQEAPKDDKMTKKKVYFEDGIFPNRDSEDEDRKIIEAKIRRKVRRLRKRHGNIKTAADILVTKDKQRSDETKIDPALERLPPPPPPIGTPRINLEQPIYLRPPTPTPFFYFHFDALVHSMYVSQLERPIPPRLLNPKCIPPAVVNAQQTSSPHAQSPVSSNMLGGKKELTAISQRAPTRNERGSPKLSSSAVATVVTTQQRRDNVAAQQIKTHPPTTPEIMPPTAAIASPLSNTASAMSKGTFQAIAAQTVSPQVSPHLSPLTAAAQQQQQQQRQTSPLGFVGMRINNFMRLPPSPLARPLQPISVRHTYSMPPPTANATAPPRTACPPPASPNDFAIPPPTQQQYGYAPPPMPAQHHTQFLRQPPPNYFLKTTAPPPPVPQHALNLEGAILQQHNNSPQAMIAPYNVKRP